MKMSINNRLENFKPMLSPCLRWNIHDALNTIRIENGNLPKADDELDYLLNEEYGYPSLQGLFGIDATIPITNAEWKVRLNTFLSAYKRYYGYLKVLKDGEVKAEVLGWHDNSKTKVIARMRADLKEKYSYYTEAFLIVRTFSNDDIVDVVISKNRKGRTKKN